MLAYKLIFLLANCGKSNLFLFISMYLYYPIILNCKGGVLCCTLLYITLEYRGRIYTPERYHLQPPRMHIRLTYLYPRHCRLFKQFNPEYQRRIRYTVHLSTIRALGKLPRKIFSQKYFFLKNIYCKK